MVDQLHLGGEGRSRESSDQNRGPPDAKTVAPFFVIVGLICVPIAIWALTSSGDKAALSVVSGTSPFGGGPEIVVSVPRSMNTTKTTKGKAAVSLKCTNASGKVVLSEKPDWPFIEEPGYTLPHAHQSVTQEQLRQIARCRLNVITQSLEGNLQRRRQP